MNDVKSITNDIVQNIMQDKQRRIALVPNFTEALVNCANIYKAQQKYVEALGDYDTAIAGNLRFLWHIKTREEFMNLRANMNWR